MGCLLELFVEFFAELFFELVGYCYIKLMQLIVPQKTISKKVRTVIKRTATVVAALLGVALIVGIILFLQADPVVKTVGKYMTYIPLIIIAVQIALGIVVKIIEHFRKNKITEKTQ